MPLWTYDLPPWWVTDAVATDKGWTNPETGEVIVALRQLDTRAGIGDLLGVHLIGSQTTFKVGDHIDFHARFNEAVTVTGTPKITIAMTNPATVTADYVSGSGSGSLLFRYTVQVADTSAAGTITVSSPLIMIGATIVDTTTPANHPAVTFTPPVLTTLVVDGIAPVRSGSAVLVGGPAFNTGDIIRVTQSFSEPVIVSGGIPYIVLTIGAFTKHLSYASGSSTSTLTFAYTVEDGVFAIATAVSHAAAITLNGATIKDVAGNALASGVIGAADLSGVSVADNLAPAVVSVTLPANKTYTSADNMDFVVHFTSPVLVVGVPRIVLTVGSLTRYASYNAGSATTALTFRYTPSVGDVDGNGVGWPASIALNGGTILDTSNNASALTLPGQNTTGLLVNAPV